jgi:glycogen phosphorylase
VAELHSELLKSTVMKDFNELWPEKFHNVTNGVTPRRFIVVSNPRLAACSPRRCGSDRWLRDLACLRELEPHADDPSLHTSGGR